MKKRTPPHFRQRPAKPGYRQQYGLILVCQNERDQSRLFRRMKRELTGREIKVVVT